MCHITYLYIFRRQFGYNALALLCNIVRHNSIRKYLTGTSLAHVLSYDDTSTP